MQRSFRVSSDAEDSLEHHKRRRRIEVDVIVVPGDAERRLAAFLKGSVDGMNVLVAAHLTNPSLRGRVDCRVRVVQAHSVPSHSDLGVRLGRAVENAVDVRQDGKVRER